ncbi:hypothetical protein TBK1r_62330 [Stieleria magnilauensis]|uniref:Uncharacterized protein n=1 Tax=Stieleria magnilauensis TaxID=2527963 RepID=A0ABX5Y514_9BACT|nr:hypothetical protein TBK1r_62330 [Planctomycetes bacterium TBK1r]
MRARVVVRIRQVLKRRLLDEEYVRRLAERIRKVFPGCAGSKRCGHLSHGVLSRYRHHSLGLSKID